MTARFGWGFYLIWWLAWNKNLFSWFTGQCQNNFFSSPFELNKYILQEWKRVLYIHNVIAWPLFLYFGLFYRLRYPTNACHSKSLWSQNGISLGKKMGEVSINPTTLSPPPQSLMKPPVPSIIQLWAWNYHFKRFYCTCISTNKNHST